MRILKKKKNEVAWDYPIRLRYVKSASEIKHPVTQRDKHTFPDHEFI
jgi:hypothetical protein